MGMRETGGRHAIHETFGVLDPPNEPWARKSDTTNDILGDDASAHPE